MASLHSNSSHHPAVVTSYAHLSGSVASVADSIDYLIRDTSATAASVDRPSWGIWRLTRSLDPDTHRDQLLQ